MKQCSREESTGNEWDTGDKTTAGGEARRRRWSANGRQQAAKKGGRVAMAETENTGLNAAAKRSKFEVLQLLESPSSEMMRNNGAQQTFGCPDGLNSRTIISWFSIMPRSRACLGVSLCVSEATPVSSRDFSFRWCYP